jgi:hypothetical protein
MEKWNFIKLKNFYTAKDMGSKLKRPPTKWIKFFPAVHQTRD